MTVFDYAALGVLAVSVLLGCWRGIVGELLSLAAWVVAFLAAKTLAVPVSELLGSRIADGVMRYGVAFLAVFVGALLLMGMARLLLRELLRAVGLGFLDRFLGAFFGVVRGVLILMVLVLIGGLTSFPKENWWRGAVLAPPLETAVLATKPWLPADLSKRVHFDR